MGFFNIEVERKLFLCWLFYVVLVAFLAIIGWVAGFISIALKYDPTYITYGIILVYICSEAYQAMQITKLDSELEKLRRVESTISPHGGFDIKMIPRGLLFDHIKNLGPIISLCRKTNKKMDQTVLLDNLGDTIYAKNYGSFIGDFLIRAGLLGTIIGLVIAFLPFIEQAFSGTTTFDPGQIQSIITQLFRGVSAAFFTTAAGLICGTLLTISGRIYEAGIDKVLDKITVITETKIIPRLMM